MYRNEVVEQMMQEHQQCLPRTLLGGYTLIYFDQEDNVLCSDCATEDSHSITDVQTYDEGADQNCHNCNKVIESSYGDPTEETE